MLSPGCGLRRRRRSGGGSWRRSHQDTGRDRGESGRHWGRRGSRCGPKAAPVTWLSHALPLPQPPAGALVPIQHTFDSHHFTVSFQSLLSFSSHVTSCPSETGNRSLAP